jgi:hypothetical protein
LRIDGRDRYRRNPDQFKTKGEQYGMKIKLTGILAAGALLAGLAGMADAYGAGGNIVTFDPPGAGTGAYQGTGCMFFPCALAINDSGTITGSYADANNVNYAFIRSPEGRFTIFQAPGADTTPNSGNGTGATSINDEGAVAGYFFDAKGTAHGFIRNPQGTFVTFDVPGAVNGTYPNFVSSEGDVVGGSMDANLQWSAFLRRRDGSATAYTGPGACTSGVVAGCFGAAGWFIDPYGRAIGSYEDGNFTTRGMIRGRNGAVMAFDIPGAGTGAYQGTSCPGCKIAGNRWGAIAGTLVDANYVNHGFLRSVKGRSIVFDVLGAGTAGGQGTGCYSDCPVALNDLGEMAGTFIDANYVFHAYLRSPDGKVVTFDPAGSTGTQPQGINNEGTVVGVYMDAANVYHAFVRTRDE